MQKKNIQSWADMDAKTIQKLIDEIVEKDLRIFQFSMDVKKGENVIEKKVWLLPYSIIRSTMISCPSCKRILLNECEKEMERAELFKNLNSPDLMTRDVTMQALKTYINLYDELNPDKDGAEKAKEEKPEENSS